MAIPKVIHQLWKDADLPERYQALRRGWIRRHPGWDHRLWTDRDLEALVEARRPDLLAMFRAYPKGVNRADLGRYLVLQAFGGVYADLDCACLRPIEPLLEGAGFVIGLEPKAHNTGNRAAAGRGMERIICASFIAAEPGHPFWDRVIALAQDSAGLEDVLDQTGPFLLTRAYESLSDPDAIRVLPAERLYPFSKTDCWSGRAYDIEYWEQATREAYVAHYWDGGWFRTAPAPQGLPLDAPATINAVEPPAGTVEPWPRITALMLSVGRLERARPAIEDFLAQTYGNRELLVAAHAPEPALAEYLAGLGRADVRLAVLDAPAPPGAPIPAPLIEAVATADLCLWEEDCAHDPRRIEAQHDIRRATRAQVSLPRRRVIWQPASGRLGVSGPRPLAGALMGPRRELAALAEGAGSEEAWLTAIGSRLRCVSFDLPRLMVRIDDGAGPGDGFEAQWADASARFAPDRTEAVLAELGERLALEDRRRPPMAGMRPASGLADASARPPKVLVLTPVKNARRHLRTYLTLLHQLDGQGLRLTLGLLESDSSDGSYEALAAAVPGLHRHFERVTLLRRDYGFQPQGPRWAAPVQRRRREILARSRNRLLGGALRDEDWVLWLDADLADYPPDLLQRLLGAGREIVAANCVRADGKPFDLNTFRFSPESGGRDDPRHLIDGLFQPPPGHGRLYLDAFEDQPLVQVDAVGGTALLVRADLHREGLVFPPMSYRGYIETEGLAMMARDMGRTCWAMPQLRIVHAEG